MGNLLRCASCSHWNESDDAVSAQFVTAGVELGRCMATQMLWDVSKESDEDRPDGQSQRTLNAEAIRATAFAKDVSGHKAWLLTTASHGCTMHSLGENR